MQGDPLPRNSLPPGAARTGIASSISKDAVWLTASGSLAHRVCDAILCLVVISAIATKTFGMR
jgi:hypothetical protein